MTLYEKYCAICGTQFTTEYQRKNMCSHDCKMEARRRNSRKLMRNKRHGYARVILGSCVICGFSETVDIHHEEEKTYLLCPNHHALITRGIKKIEELIPTCG